MLTPFVTRGMKSPRPAGRRSSWLIVAMVTAVGCGEAQRAAAPLPLKFEDLPPAFVETARKELPGVRFDSAFRKPDGTLEIRGREKSGKVREVEIRPDGTVEEIE